MSTLNPSDLEEDARHGVTDDLFSPDQGYILRSDTLELFGNDSVSMASQDAFENNKLASKPGAEKSDSTNMTVDNISALNSEVNSPRETVSPTASSPFSAMESDGEGIETGQDDANLSCAGDQSFNHNNGYLGASTPLHTTTPCASSSCCDDEYESMGNRKKRRKTRRDMHHVHPGLSVVPVMKQPNSEWPQDNETSPFSPPTCTKGMNFAFGSKNIRTSGGLGSNQQEEDFDEFPPGNAKRTRKSAEPVDEEMNVANIKTEAPSNMDSVMALVQTTPVTKRGKTPSTTTTVTTEEEQELHKQYPRKSGSYELHIITQPEPQHRARYLTEGSRGPVKDASQTGFPKVQLLGYTKAVILQVFVATDSGKIKPHGFYQACRVTGRNTSPCEEIEIQGTKVIEIPFKQEDGCMVLNIDCVGILKLRNTDVEVRTGLRNQKRNQSVRLVFRVALMATASNGRPVVLQAASSRISCTQPLGQPEITKKSIDRCSVEGGTEMFIIGKNFHRGTKVIYQDPEEPNGTQWTAEGEIEKDTFHQYHMVVHVPPYHDQNIVKPVNVQLIVEFQDKKCEPHSFTYTPKPKEPEPAKEETKQPAQVMPNTNIESAFSMLEGPLDKKFIVALFSKLLSNSNVSNQSESQSGTNTPSKVDPIGLTSANTNPTDNTHTLLHAVLQSQAGGAPVQVLNDATHAMNPSPVSPPSTLFAAISVQNPQPIFAKPITNNVPLQTQVMQTFVRGNAATNLSSPVANIDASANPAQRLIKSEAINAEAHPSFSVTTTVPAFQMCKSQSTSLAIGNLSSVAVTMAETVASPNMVVSPVTGQDFQPGLQPTVCYNSFAPSHQAIATLINSAPGLAVSATHTPAVSQFNNVHVDPSMTNQVVKVPINDGFLQFTDSTMTAVSVGGNAPSTFSVPVSNFQVGQMQQTQQTMLPNMTVSRLIPVHTTPSVVEAEHVQFSQGSTSGNLQNTQGLIRTNVLQQPTFTFQPGTNVVSTATVQNPQITTKTVATSQGAFVDQVHFAIDTHGQRIQQQPVVITTPQNQQSFAIYTDGVHQQTATIALATKDEQNQPSSFANSLSDINQPFIVQSQNHQVFHQQHQQFDKAQTQPSNTLPAVFQVNNAFSHQFSQMQTDKNPGTNQAHIQTMSAGPHSEEKQMQVDSFPVAQNPNQVCPTTISPINAMSVQTAVQPMNGVLTQNFTNTQVNTVRIEDHQMADVVSAGNQTQYNTILITSQHIPMAAETSPPSNSETSPPTATDNSQQIAAQFGISSQTFQVAQPTDTVMIQEPTANQPMELGQSNMAPTQGNFHMQQQQPQQSTNTAMGHDAVMPGQSYQVDHTANMHNSTSFSSLQQQVTAQGQIFQATNISGEVTAGDVEIAVQVPKGGLQQPIQSTNNVTNFQDASLVNDVTNANFNNQNFQTLPKSPQMADIGQAFQGAGATMGNVHNASNLDNFKQSLHQQSPPVVRNNDNSGNAENRGFQGLQQAQNVNLPVGQNFQTTSINFNVATAVLEQQTVQSTQQANASVQAMMVVDNFQQQAVSITTPQIENTVTAVTFHSVMADQQYQAPNQSTQSAQSVISTGNASSQASTKTHIMTNHAQSNEALNMLLGNHGSLQNPALHRLGQLQAPRPCATNTVNRPLEPRSPDIYAMHEVLRSINGEQELAAITGEDVQRHCQ